MRRTRRPRATGELVIFAILCFIFCANHQGGKVKTEELTEKLAGGREPGMPNTQTVQRQNAEADVMLLAKREKQRQEAA